MFKLSAAKLCLSLSMVTRITQIQQCSSAVSEEIPILGKMHTSIYLLQFFSHAFGERVGQPTPRPQLLKSVSAWLLGDNTKPGNLNVNRHNCRLWRGSGGEGSCFCSVGAKSVASLWLVAKPPRHHCKRDKQQLRKARISLKTRFAVETKEKSTNLNFSGYGISQEVFP